MNPFSTVLCFLLTTLGFVLILAVVARLFPDPKPHAEAPPGAAPAPARFTITTIDGTGWAACSSWIYRDGLTGVEYLVVNQAGVVELRSSATGARP